MNPAPKQIPVSLVPSEAIDGSLTNLDSGNLIVVSNGRSDLAHCSRWQVLLEAEELKVFQWFVSPTWSISDLQSFFKKSYHSSVLYSTSDEMEFLKGDTSSISIFVVVDEHLTWLVSGQPIESNWAAIEMHLNGPASLTTN